MDCRNLTLSSDKKTSQTMLLPRKTDIATFGSMPASSIEKKARTPVAASHMKAKRLCDLGIPPDMLRSCSSVKKTQKSGGSKVKLEPKRTEEILKMLGMDVSPVPKKFRKQLWSVQKSSSKKATSQATVTANKSNIRKSIFTKPAHRRTSTMAASYTDQTLPLIDLEELEQNPNKLKRSLRIPQITVHKPPAPATTKRQTIHQNKFAKPVTRPVLPATAVKYPGQHKTTRRQSARPAATLAGGLGAEQCQEGRTAVASDLTPIYGLLKEVLCRMDRLELTMKGRVTCDTCGMAMSGEQVEKLAESRALNTLTGGDTDVVENTVQAPRAHSVSTECDNVCSIETESPGNPEQTLNTAVKIRSEPTSPRSETVLSAELCPPPLTAANLEDNDTGNKQKQKSHFERLETELQNASITSLPFFDSDDSESPRLTDINFDYLLSAKKMPGTTAPSGNARPVRHASTDSDEAIRTYNEMRKNMPMLCTPKRSKSKTVSLMTPSVQHSHKKLLSRRIQEQLVRLNNGS